MVTAMPRQELRIELPEASAIPLEIRLRDGRRQPLRAGSAVRWRVPAEPSLETIEIGAAQRARVAMRLHVFVLRPASEVRDEHLWGYRIGTYPSRPSRGLAAYRPPPGFIEVTSENRATPVSPHFTLEQFLCRQAGGYPKYLVLRERLLLKLEYLLELVNAKGFAADTFAVLSGFRTPFYNRAIGNVTYSRHQWGGAADIFIDEDPRDGRMDDLNRDGQIGQADAHLLYDLIDSASGAASFQRFTGGLGSYGHTASHGPFVHVDVRGHRFRWGR